MSNVSCISGSTDTYGALKQGEPAPKSRSQNMCAGNTYHACNPARKRCIERLALVRNQSILFSADGWRAQSTVSVSQPAGLTVLLATRWCGARN